MEETQRLYDYKLYVSYSNVGNPRHARLAFKYYHILMKYEYILRCNWTGLGSRRDKLKRIITKSKKLANYHAAKQAGIGNEYRLSSGKIGCDNLYFLSINSL